MKRPMIHLVIPLPVARFLYTVLEHFLENPSGAIKLKLTPGLREELIALYDNLAVEITTST